MKAARSKPDSERTVLLRADTVLPISRPLIRNGALLVSGTRIRKIGRWSDFASVRPHQVVDLGRVVLMPGLVNAHCHLDYTLMAGQFPPPKVFTDWLKLITEGKSGWDKTDYRRSWLAGAAMLTRTGTTTVADIEALPQLLPKCWKAAPLRVFSLLEMIGITNRRSPKAILEEALRKIDSLPSGRCRAGLSPHAPYSTTPELLRLAAKAAQRRRLPICVHVGESRLEYDMFAHRKGAMFQWIERSGRSMDDCGKGSPVRHLGTCGLLRSNLLAAHANYLGRGDAALLAAHGVHVVHCPRSHSYFRHDPFPLARLMRADVNVCLGTDSLASVYRRRGQKMELDLFAEMRALAEAHPGVQARQILRMATVNGACALGLPGQLGEFTEGAFADLIALDVAKAADQNIYESVLQHQGPVWASMIAGRWAIPPRQGRP